MHSDEREQIRKYIHVEAMMKHVTNLAQEPALSWGEDSVPVRGLIERVNQSQKKKWREYAQTNTRGNSSSSRTDVA